nr:immunoglobulin light chain junction region [Macaca mulatta]MOV80762.1 immunoglobulin light chain junction region [Macaca mulatta]MOV81467.1 immunoglobulin light chain junction region [Macaca mulatta]
CQQYNTDPPTF